MKSLFCFIVSAAFLTTTAAGQLTITNDSLPDAQVNSAYSTDLTATGGTSPYSWNVSQMYWETVESNMVLTATNAMDWHSDNAGWWHPLPFTFSLYGVGYTQCFITTEGYIHFTAPYLDENPSTNTLMTNCMIAADWKNMSTVDTFGNEDIFIYNSATQCVIRWVCTTPMFGFVMSSLQLNRDGVVRIDNSYDSDMMTQPVIGLSAGNGNDFVVTTNIFASWNLGENMKFDFEDDGLPYSVILAPTGTLYGTPYDSGTSTVTFTVADSTGTTTSKTLSLVVTDSSNQQPVINSNTPASHHVDLDEGTTNIFTVFASDPESQPLTYEWQWNGSVVATTAYQYTFIADWGDAGTGILRVTIADDVWTNNPISTNWYVAITNDNDGDALPNAWERSYGLDPWTPNASSDPDGDSLSNLEEYQNGCSPTNSDTDGDSLEDLWEIENSMNPTSAVESVPGYTNWTQVDGILLSAHAEAVYLTNGIAYTACGLGGLKVFDVSDPTNPQLLDMLDIPEYTVADSIWMTGTMVILPIQEYGLWVLDASQPTNITLLGEYNPGGHFYGPVVEESNRLYLAQNTDLAVLCITNPAAPTLLGSIRVASTNGAYHIHDLRVSGGWVYCANYTEGLKTVDARNPASMSIVFTNDFTAVGVCDYAARGLDIEGDKLYMCQDGYGLMSFDISNSDEPALLDNIIPSSVPFPYDALDDVWVEGTNAVIYGGTNLWTLNVSDPANMSEYGRWTMNGPYFSGVMFNSTTCMVTAGWGTVPGEGLNRGGLITLDISNPASVQQESQYITSGQTWDMEVLSGIAYIANYDAGIRVVHVANPTNLHYLGRYDTDGRAIGIDVSTSLNLAFVADEDAGLTVLDISDPTNLTLVAQVADIGRVEDVAYNNGFIYVANYTNGLLIMTNASSPSVLTNLSRGVSHKALTTYGSIIFAGCGANGVYKYSLDGKSSNDTWEIESYSYVDDVGMQGSAGRLETANGKLWVADSFVGIVAFDILDGITYAGCHRNPLASALYPVDDYIWFGSPTNLCSFRTDTLGTDRGVWKKNRFWYDPFVKGLWCNRTNGMFIGNPGASKYKYGIRMFAMQRIDEDDDGMRDEDEMDWFGSLDETRDGDADGDGLSNWGESISSTDPSLFDTDGDGMNDRDEYITGTDPASDGSLFMLDIPPAGMELFDEIVIDWPSREGREYDLFRWTDLDDIGTRRQLLTNAPATPPPGVWPIFCLRL